MLSNTANPNYYYDDQAVDGFIAYTIVQKGLMLLSSEKLYHHGIKGQRWGVRRFQNEDGSLTSAGRSRYLNSDGSLNRKGKKEIKKWEKRINNGNSGWLKSYNRASDEFNRTIEEINKRYDGKDLGGD